MHINYLRDLSPCQMRKQQKIGLNVGLQVRRYINYDSLKSFIIPAQNTEHQNFKTSHRHQHFERMTHIGLIIEHFDSSDLTKAIPRFD